MGNKAYRPWFDEPKALGERGDEGELTKDLKSVEGGTETADCSLGRSSASYGGSASICEQRE